MILRHRLPIALLSLGFLAACGDSSLDSTAPPPLANNTDIGQQTITLPSRAEPAHTPGTPGVTVSNPKILAQFGDAPININNARYTRFYLSEQDGLQPDAILITVPGFEAGASTFTLFAENSIHRAMEDQGLRLEVWAVDRRSNQMEDTSGLDLAESLMDPEVGLNFLFGDELSLPMDPALASDINRRAEFYNTAADLAFMAQWTPLVHSIDIDAIVEAALEKARNDNVFLGGHSAGTGYTARYAATDFDPDPVNVVAGHSKLRGLVLLEGGGSSVSDSIPDSDTLDLIEAKFDGGLYAAVRDQMPYCIDGQTTCTPDTEATDCAAFSNTQCVQPTTSYATFNDLLSPQLLAISEVNAIDATISGDYVQSILQRDFNEPGNNALAKVPQLTALSFLVGSEPASSVNLLGQFLDDDGVVANLASFVATSLGAPAPAQNGVVGWYSLGEDIPEEAYEDLGPAPTSLDDARRWGVGAEPTDLKGRMLPIFYRGQTNFSDWYYPSAGLSVTSGLSLDTTALSAPPPIGRGRSDIDNRTEAGNIAIPVIAFGGSNGLTPLGASWLGFASSIAPCTAPSCDGTTPRIVDLNNPNPAFPSYGDVAGGFEVYIAEGYAHVDVVSAEDDETNNVIGPLVAFIQRNIQ